MPIAVAAAPPTWCTDFHGDVSAVDVPAPILRGTADNRPAGRWPSDLARVRPAQGERLLCACAADLRSATLPRPVAIGRPRTATDRPPP
ncbi:MULTISPECIES: hypothetical protein [unclassified Streptomyces]|uniref:hypothetical protein n=1 Tax=unclassified Streptomyces TaxID=2593676 RepID=UPI0004C9B877|nr:MULTISPECIES: hypothetical protein [unclassified Streptomyces]KOX01638.1 hypothetical protein ADL02_02270 [Streptomyces sp. NRRL WC-3723]